MEHLDFGGGFVCATLQPMLISCADEATEQWMRLQRLRFKLRMKLAANEMRMIRQLNHLDVGAVWGRARNSQSACRQRAFVFAVKLVAMPMALADLKLSINSVCQSSRFNLAGPSAQPHGAAQLFHAAQFAQLVDHAMRRCRIELAGVSVRETTDVAGELDASRLHPQANAKEGNFVLPRVADCNQHAFNPAFAKSAGHQNPTVIPQLLFVGWPTRFQSLGLNPVQIKF